MGTKSHCQLDQLDVSPSRPLRGLAQIMTTTCALVFESCPMLTTDVNVYQSYTRWKSGQPNEPKRGSFDMHETGGDISTRIMTIHQDLDNRIGTLSTAVFSASNVPR